MSEEKTTEVKQPEKILCPCCGKETLVKPVTVSAAICDSYMAGILSGQPFSREYELYDGKLVVRATMPDTATANRLRSLGYLLGLATQHMSNVTKMAADEYMTAIMQLIQIKVIAVKGASGITSYPVQERLLPIIGQMESILKQPVAPATEQDGLAASAAANAQTNLLEQLKKLALMTFDASIFSAVPRPLLAKVIDRHNELFAILLDQGFDDDFWAGIRLG